MTVEHFANEAFFSARAQRIQLLVLDVDGVLTDGGIIVHADGSETKRFHVRDGLGIRMWQWAGGRVAVITGRTSPAVAHRCQDLDIEMVRQGARDKAPAFAETLKQMELTPADACVLGDDLPDLPLMTASGLAMAPADAHEEVRRRAHYVCECGGGRGAVREAVERLLIAQGRWKSIVDRYAQPASLDPFEA